jgi:hypothetical protein
MKITILRKTLIDWLERKLWRHVLFLCVAGILLAGVSILKGWLHQKVGFDDQGKPLGSNATPNGTGPASSSSAKPRFAVSDVAAYRIIVDDLQRRDDEVRPRLRYLTLWHRHNEPNFSTVDLEADRQAIRDVMSIISHGQSSHGAYIDPDQLIFRLNLEDLDWSAETDWHRVAANYRYGLRGDDDEPLSKLRRHVEDFTQESVPVVRGDWFVVAITRPPLAAPNGLLKVPTKELPESIRDLRSSYADETLDVAGCARELGLSDPRPLTDLIRQQTRLQEEFGLASLLRGERIRRDWWESDRNFFSPYQELARLFKFGKPVRVQ